MAHCVPLSEPNCSCTPDDAYHLYARSILGLKSGSVLKANVGTRRKREFIPEDQKDVNYWSKRNRNNEAAKRSRQRKRMEEYLLETRAVQLLHENEKLRTALSSVQCCSSDRQSNRDSMKHCYYDALGRTTFLSPSQLTPERGMDFWSYDQLGLGRSRLSCLPSLTNISLPSGEAGTDALPVLYFPSSNLSGNCTLTCAFNPTGTYSHNEITNLDVREKCVAKMYSDSVHFELNETVPPQINQNWEYLNPTCETGKVPVRPLDNQPASLARSTDVYSSGSRNCEIADVTKDVESMKPTGNGVPMPLLPHKLRFKTSRKLQGGPCMNTYRCPSEDQKLEATSLLEGTEARFPVPSAQYLWYANRQPI